MLYVRSRWPTLRHGLGHDLGRFKQPPDHLGEPEREIWDDVIRDFKGSRASYFVLLSGLEAHMRAAPSNKPLDHSASNCNGRNWEVATCFSLMPS
jgi:hypothetical protein